MKHGKIEKVISYFKTDTNHDNHDKILGDIYMLISFSYRRQIQSIFATCVMRKLYYSNFHHNLDFFFTIAKAYTEAVLEG